LLAGCVIEEARYDLDMQDRDWGPFYAAVGSVGTETALCSPDTLRSQQDWGVYVDSFLVELNQRLVGIEQAAVPVSAALKDRLKETFGALVTRFSGDASSIIGGRSWSTRRRLDVAYERLANLPTLKSASMRAQFVKLAAVWDVWHDVPLMAFRFPFA